MNQDQFVASRQARWQELAGVLTQIQKQGVRRLPLERVQRLGDLYRQTASDLAYTRTYFPGSRTSTYLNTLVSQAHSTIYAEEPQRLRALWQTLAHIWPQTVRLHWRAIALATAMLLVGGAIGLTAVLYDPNLAEALVPEGILAHVVSPQERFDFAPQNRPLIGTAIMLNNVRVGVMAFALGIILGLGTGLILFYNGVMLGAVTAQAVQTGHLFDLWGYVLAHGALELTAIFICGGAGLVMGWSIVSPGERTRGAALAAGARDAVQMVMVSVGFFVVAAVIEGWVTPMQSLPVEGKYAVGVVTGIAGLAYLALGGRKAKAALAP